MLATLIFAVIMAICFQAIASISRTYIKGVTETRLQSAGQVIVNTIGDSIKGTGAELEELATSTGGWDGYCIAGVIYSFKTGFQLVEKDQLPNPLPSPNHKTEELLVRRQAAGDCVGASPDPAPSGSGGSNQELLQPGIRLLGFEISNDIDPYLYKISLEIANGGDINNAALDAEVFEFDSITNEIVGCKPRQETCSVLSLTKEVYQRIQK